MKPRFSDKRRRELVRLVVLALAVAAAAARAQDTADTLAQALREGRIALELSYRYEHVDAADFTLHANASLLRTRLSYESAASRGTTLGIEVDDLRAIVADDFNDTRNARVDRPIVADPKGTEINRAYVAYRTSMGSRLAVGRVRLETPRRRFVASRNWRLNEQTFDALTATHAINERLTIDYAYVWNVNRIFGPDSGQPAADLGGAMHIVDGLYALESGARLQGYGYFLDFDDEPTVSSATVGLRFSSAPAVGDTLTLPYSLELARQYDYGDNPIGYAADYLSVAGGLSGEQFRIAISFERLDGDGRPGHVLTTPLAGLNGVNGWADQFVTTPDQGLEDLVVTLALPLGRGELSLHAHEFSAASGGADYGDELDVELAWPIDDRYSLLLRFADYRAESHAVDTTKAWAMLTARF